MMIPTIVYSDTELELTEPQKLWTPMARPVGGSATSDAGVLEAFTLRRDQLCKCEIRFTEAQWEAVDTWLEWAQNGGVFTFYFDKSNVDSSYECYLDSPTPGDGEVSPSRDSYSGIYTLSITIRTTNGTRFTHQARE